MIDPAGGRRHAGENLARMLARREPGRAPPLHMRYGLKHNKPAGHATVPCGCAVHARRIFVELQADFPEECRRGIASFAEIYRVEAQAKAAGLDAPERLAAHQATSLRVMDELAAWFKSQQAARQVEPNSGLGQAIAYMQKRWDELTQFLHVPGAPLDNNAAERILKLANLHRKNSLFYLTARGAQVGDWFMSLIETCRANQANPFDYLLAVVRNASAAKASPDRWLPWNYRDNPVPAPETGSVTARN